MADKLNGRVVTLGSGTLGIAIQTPLAIEAITITWSGASAGNVLLEDINDDLTPANTIISAKTLALASGNLGLLTQTIYMNGKIFSGVTKTAVTGVDGEQGIQILLR